MNARRPAGVFLALVLVLAAALPAEAQRRGGGRGQPGGSGPSAERMMQMMDDDGDGRIGRDEWRRDEAEFDEIDTNKDGFVDADELKRFIAENFDPSRNPMHPAAPRDLQAKAGLIETGLMAAFPPTAGCPQVASPFGVSTRHDGSLRNANANHGLHGGTDIPANIGTPLIAIADGEVVHKFTGGLLVGHQIFLRHTPQDTGLPFFIYSKYKHFDRLPGLEIGQRVKMGEVLGPSGNSGTVGGYYGGIGYAHLHISIYATEDPGYRTTRMSVFPKAVRYLDTLAIYLPATLKTADNHAARTLAAEAKKVAVPYIGADGKVRPTGARLVWPFRCKGS